MVVWRSATSFAVLLRIARNPPSCAVPRTVASSFPAFVVSKVSETGTLPPRDDGEHDPEIDLITLRRKSKSTAETIPPNQSQSVPNAPITPVTSHKATDGTLTRKGTAMTEDLNSGHLRESQSILDKSEGQINASESGSKDTTVSKGTKFYEPFHAFGTREMDGVNHLDPYLEHYLRTLPSKSQKYAKSQIIPERNSGRQDRDVEFLHPNDVRATYNLSRQSTHMTQRSIGAANVPAAPGHIPDNVVDAGIQRLKLPSSGDRVVIPRAVLGRLIEQTITLSGAALHGDDVVIERYSPTWHRFARLLRTSDLDKLSALAKPNRVAAKYPKKLEVEEGITESVVPENVKLPEIQPPSVQGNVNKDSKHDASKISEEREYIILALDSKKKRVVSTKFRRLLDGAPQDVAPSSDSLLKVDCLDKYLPHLKPLESEGFYILAASETGIVLSKSLKSPNLESREGADNQGWLRSLIKRT